MEMTITRALSELKTLQRRINDKIGSTLYIAGAKKSSKKINNVYTREEFDETVKSNYQSVKDLIERRKVIKSAIIESNAKTLVTIAGKEMTVADAIERKDSISFEQTLLNVMVQQYNSIVAQINRENDKVNDKLNSFIEQMLGKEGKNNPDDVKKLSETYLAENEFEVVNPLQLQVEIEKLKNDIETFTQEVDFCLSESNTITRIAIPD